MDWRISRALAERVLADVAASPAVEICGLLLGKIGEISKAQACLNVSASPATRFEIDPAALIAAHKVQRAGGPAIIGCYHSHPNGVAAPSAEDRNAGFAGLWVIVAGGALHGWEGDGRGGFVPARLLIA